MGTHAHARPALTSQMLIAIARRVMREEPMIDFAGLNEAIKIRIAREGYAYPPPHDLTEAMTRVIPALPPDPAPPAPPLVAVPAPLTRDEARAALTALVDRFGPLPALKPRVVPRVL